MVTQCFNCKKNISSEKPICPYCFAVQKDRFSREELFDFLEIYFPTKPNVKERFVSTKKKIHIRNYDLWLVLGIFTLGIAYYFYLVLTLKDLNDHWMHPHGYYEKTTKNDVFIAFVILLFLNFLGVPLIQFIRYNKLREHMLKAPPLSYKQLPVKGSRIFWIYIAFDVLFGLTINAFFFGVSSIVADKYIPIDSTQIAIIFFLGAGLILLTTVLLGIVIIMIETRWQRIFNYHISYHHGIEHNTEILNFESDDSRFELPNRES